MDLTQLEMVQDVPVLHVTGDVDLATAEQLRSAVNEMLALSTSRVVIDLSTVKFLDSAGLEVLDDVQRRAAHADVRIALACPHDRLVRLLQITGLNDQFLIYANPESAAHASDLDAC